MKIAKPYSLNLTRRWRTLARVLERVPAAKFSWKPHPKSFEFGALAAHIANMADWAGLTLANRFLRLCSSRCASVRDAKVRVHAGSAGGFRQERRARRAPLWPRRTMRKMLAPWTLMAGGKTMMTMPRVAVIRTFVMNHTIHHRAQLGVYLRLNDIPVPALYGPTRRRTIAPRRLTARRRNRASDAGRIARRRRRR